MRRKETDRIQLQRNVGFSTHPTRSDALDFTWAVMKIQLIIKDVLKSSSSLQMRFKQSERYINLHFGSSKLTWMKCGTLEVQKI